MNYTLLRISKRPDVTLGVLLSPDKLPIGVTLELPDKGNKRRESCIPEGAYMCRKYTSAKYKDVWEITGVENRSKILIHAGNTVNDIEGCILIGREFGKVGKLPAVISSRLALNDLRTATDNKDFFLTIKYLG